jgi:hypothetical protein
MFVIFHLCEIGLLSICVIFKHAVYFTYLFSPTPHLSLRFVFFFKVGQEDEDPEAEMMRMMGFGGFSSTKGRVVKDNVMGASAGAVSRHKPRVYSQYMNKRVSGAGRTSGSGGFR